MTVSNSGFHHVSVMPAEVLHYLAPAPGEVIVDATVGAGGHARRIAAQLGSGGRLIGLDQDAGLLDRVRPTLAEWPVTLVHANFSELPLVLKQLGIDRVDGLVADLGVCSDQLDEAERGFRFSQDGPLDMRMNPQEGETAADLLARLNERELADLFYEYGEERASRRIARRIVQVRRTEPLRTTKQLAELVRQCLPRPRRRPGEKPSIDPATRVFQALRIAVNDELRHLDRLLAWLPDQIRPDGRAVFISFHSLEDRRVKTAFRQRDIWQELTRKPITPSEEEVANNPRARSAKLRAARRLRAVATNPGR